MSTAKFLGLCFLTAFLFSAGITGAFINATKPPVDCVVKGESRRPS